MYTPGLSGSATGATRVLSSLGSTLGLPSGAAAPVGAVSAMAEKRGSTPSLNVILISLGEALTTPPGGGAAFLRSACAAAEETSDGVNKARAMPAAPSRAHRGDEIMIGIPWSSEKRAREPVDRSSPEYALQLKAKRGGARGRAAE